MNTKQLLFIFLAVLLPLASWADVWQDPETKVNYEYTVGKSEASVKSGYYALGDITILSKFTVDSNEYSVTSIGYQAFKNCIGLTSVTIGNSVTSIGREAFRGCSGLTSVTIGNSVTSIGRPAFNGCRGLTFVTIPNSVTSIGKYAFSSCSGLVSVIIGNSVTSIGDYSFSNCSGLSFVASLIHEPFEIGESVFGWGSTLCVPMGTKEKYEATPSWNKFKNIEEVRYVERTKKLGDVNGDGAIDVADIASVISVMAGGTDISFTNADVNGDDNVDVADISTVIDIMASSINEHEVFVNTEGIGDWSEMRIASDGSYLLTKNAAGKNIPDSLVAILPSDYFGVLYSCATFDENGMPQFISINEVCIVVDDYYENYVDLTIYYNDTIAYSVDSLSLENHNSRKYAPRRSWSENNWQRNLVGIVELASGAAGVVGGALMVTGSVVSEVGSLGTSTPISIPGIVAGSVTIAGGVSTFESGWNKLFAPGEHRSDVESTIIYEEVGELISNGTREAVPYIPEQYIWWMRDPNYANQLDRAGWINFLVGLSAGLFDNRFGRTVTWEDIKRSYQGQVITGIFKDVTTNSVVVRGYISPSITRSLMDGSKLQNEYGIILYSTVDGKERYTQKVTNGDGGMIEYSFGNLKPGTIYNYVAYYRDLTNGISLLDETKSFQTKKQLEEDIINIKKVDVNYCMYHYDSKQEFGIGLWVLMEINITSDNKYISWGIDFNPGPHQYTKTYPLENGRYNWTFSVSEDYFDESSNSFNIRGYPFVIRKKDNEILYGKAYDFEVKRTDTLSCPDANHPHWIDLGLPSGTKWACCNVGASKPEEYGNYYAWGETSSKSVYNHVTYSHFTGGQDTDGNGFFDNIDYSVVNIGSNIAGTDYDAATANWGSPWHMPSLEQWKELLQESTSYETKQNGVIGWHLRGPNRKIIFLPSAGMRYGSDLYYAGANGYYWPSGPAPLPLNYVICCYSGDWIDDNRWGSCTLGLSVRPVR